MKLTAYEHKMEQRAWGLIRASCIPLIAMRWFHHKDTGRNVLVAALPNYTEDDKVTQLMRNIQGAFRKVEVSRGQACRKDDPSAKYITVNMEVKEPLTIKVLHPMRRQHGF